MPAIKLFSKFILIDVHETVSKVKAVRTAVLKKLSLNAPRNCVQKKGAKLLLYNNLV